MTNADDINNGPDEPDPEPIPDGLTAHPPGLVRGGGRRCAIRIGNLGRNWLVGWSPRNGSYCCEGSWNDWVELAKNILAEDAKIRKKGP